MNKNLKVGDVLSRTFRVYEDQISVLLLGSVIVFGVVAVVSLALAAAGIPGIGNLLSMVGSYWYAGLAVLVVAGAKAGQTSFSVGELFGRVRPYLWRLVATGLIAGIAIVIGLILLIVPGLFLLVRFAVLVPAIVLEDKRFGEAFDRSSKLVEGNGWPVLGVLFLLAVIVFAAVMVLAIVGAAAGGIVGAVLGALVASVLLSPLQGVASSVLYFDLREIKEGAGEAGPLPPQPSVAPPTPGT